MQMASAMLPGLLLLMYITKLLQFYFSKSFSQDIAFIFDEKDWQKPSEDLHYEYPLITEALGAGDIKKDFSNIFEYVSENKPVLT